MLLAFHRGTWCPNCRRKFSELAQHSPEYAARGMQVVTVVAQSSDVVRRYVEDQGLPFNILIDESRDVLKAYGVWHRLGLDAWNIARPALFLIDRTGAHPLLVRQRPAGRVPDARGDHDEIERLEASACLSASASSAAAGSGRRSPRGSKRAGSSSATTTRSWCCCAFLTRRLREVAEASARRTVGRARQRRDAAGGAGAAHAALPRAPAADLHARSRRRAVRRRVGRGHRRDESDRAARDLARRSARPAALPARGRRPRRLPCGRGDRVELSRHALPLLPRGSSKAPARRPRRSSR